MCISAIMGAPAQPKPMAASLQQLLPLWLQHRQAEDQALEKLVLFTSSSLPRMSTSLLTQLTQPLTYSNELPAASALSLERQWLTLHACGGADSLAAARLQLKHLQHRSGMTGSPQLHSLQIEEVPALTQCLQHLGLAYCKNAPATTASMQLLHLHDS
jgi:hypothetical protein